MWAEAASLSLRLLVHVAGFVTLARTQHREVSIWQLAFEPLLFWCLGHLAGKAEAKLDKTIWRQATVQPTYPLTCWREKPMRDVVELVSYARMRLLRSWRFYQQKAQGILHILFDDIFNMVIVLRLLGILFSLSPLVRCSAVFAGFGPTLDRHAEWVQKTSGFAGIGGGNFMTEKLLSLSLAEVAVVGKLLAGRAEEDVRNNINEISFSFIVNFLVWHAAFPLFFYMLERQWMNLLRRQRAAYRSQWQGVDWTDGWYASQIRSYGSFWNEVAEADWQPHL